jgi:hypothetical protein
LTQEEPRQTGRAGTPEEETQGAESPEVEARLAVLTSRFGALLTDEQWGQVRERVATTITHGEKLRAIPLTNADEPEIVFVPYRSDRR